MEFRHRNHIPQSTSFLFCFFFVFFFIYIERRETESRSDPVATEFLTSPVLVDRYAYLKACIPAQQTPDGETTSNDGASVKRPCTITPCEGII